MNKNKKLAIYGGPKVFSKKLNHFYWPPKSSRTKINFINNFIKKDKLNNKGFPIVVEKF